MVKRGYRAIALRLLLAISVGIIGAVATLHSVAVAIGKGDTELAHRLDPSNGQITASLAQALLATSATEAERRRVGDLAHLSLRQDPTAVAGVATLGLRMQLAGDATGARAIFNYAEHLSRRHLPTNVWRIEDAVARGDVANALKYYDLALRTSSQAPDLLFPILSSAVGGVPVRVALIQTLARRPMWGPEFLIFAADRGVDVSGIAQLFLDMRRYGVFVSDEAQAKLIKRLVNAGMIDNAWAVYAAFRPGVDRGRSRDPDFRAAGVPTFFDWTPTPDAGIDASVQRTQGGGLVNFSAPSGVGGAALQQTQVLPPGVYRIEGRSRDIDEQADARPYWTLRCNDGRELGHVDLTNSAEANGKFAGRFVVPTGCPMQALTLMIRPSDAVGGVSGQIERASLRGAP